MVRVWSACRPQMVGSVSPNLTPRDQELQLTKPFRPDRQARLKGLFSGSTVVIAKAKSLGPLAPVLAGRPFSRFTGTKIKNTKQDMSTLENVATGSATTPQLGEMLG